MLVNALQAKLSAALSRPRATASSPSRLWSPVAGLLICFVPPFRTFPGTPDKAHLTKKNVDTTRQRAKRAPRMASPLIRANPANFGLVSADATAALRASAIGFE